MAAASSCISFTRSRSTARLIRLNRSAERALQEPPCLCLITPWCCLTLIYQPSSLLLILRETAYPSKILSLHMQLDSHRRKRSSPSIAVRPRAVHLPATVETPAITTTTTDNMPCPRSRCGVSKTFKLEDGTEMRTWHSVRMENLRNMRKMVKRVLLYMALIEALRVGPDMIVFAGQKGYPDKSCNDFGISYYAAYVLSWLYLCVFTIVWKPLFSVSL